MQRLQVEDNVPEVPPVNEPIAAAVDVIRAGGIVAIQSASGYHLSCDATNAAAVARLREWKQREAKPFAVMVASAVQAAVFGELDDAAVQLLESPAAPIVLVPKRAANLADAVAPYGADIGLLLPHTPLQRRLMQALSPNGALVMTSANVSDEPIVVHDDVADARLAQIATMIVRETGEPSAVPCDDSVARVIDGAPMILRRARGYAEEPLRLPLPIDRPTLAVGGHGKAAFAYASGDVVVMSPHLGDLDDVTAYERYVAAVEQLGKQQRIKAEQVVCDMHPDYATTRFAEQLGLPTIAVQHHHAHFASVFADAGVHGPAIGVIFDGSGYGTDGAIWGGEIFVGDPADVWRAAHLQYVAQPGGDRAAHEPWRMAVAYLADAGEPYADFAPEAVHVAGLCGRAPRTSSVGRLFDAVAAMIGVAGSSSFEGQAAMRLEALARGAAAERAYPFELSGDELIVTPVIRAIAKDAQNHVAPARIARRFHTTIVELAAYACEQLARGEGLRDVVLSGDVFQNAIIASELPRRLRELGLVPHVHRRVPPNDGGLAFGQLVVAAARGGV